MQVDGYGFERCVEAKTASQRCRRGGWGHPGSCPLHALDAHLFLIAFILPEASCTYVLSDVLTFSIATCTTVYRNLCSTPSLSESMVGRRKQSE
jgi:hypothetical protein